MIHWCCHSADTATQIGGLSERLFKYGVVCVVTNNDLDGDFVFSSSCRLHTAQRAIKQTQVTVQKIGKEIEEKLRTTATCTERVSAVTHRQHFAAHQQRPCQSEAAFRALICFFFFLQEQKVLFLQLELL